MENQGSNKTIAKNTIFLYFRSFLMMVISLFSSRVILQALGVDDYGLYGAIGSIVAMFAMINGVLSVGTSRFLTFELGRNDSVRLKKTFSASFAMHVAMAVCLFILLETIGLWFLNHKMNIPEGRGFAANVIYQFSILTSMLSLTQVPYSAIIIAHERMNIYAYVGIAEAVFKLLLIFLLLYVPFTDNLIAYAAILAIWSIGLQVWYRYYCHKHFVESHLGIVREKEIYKGMLTYSLWDFLGQICGTGNKMGINILINMFFGVAVNAARAIAYQVEAAVTQFSANFLTAVQPQIVKSYARGDDKRFFQLIYESGKFSYYLLFMITLPLFLEADYILQLWLVEVPPLSALFLRFVSSINLFRVIARPVINGVHATGDVKFLNLTCGLYCAITILPAIYILYELGFPAWYCHVVTAINAAISSILEAWALYRKIKYNVLDYIIKVYVHSISISALAAIIPVVICVLLSPSFGRLLLTVVSSVLSTSFVVYTLGINKETRIKLNDYIAGKLKINHH